MAFWVLNFTKSGAKEKKQLAVQARKLLDLELWGIPPGNPQKDKMKLGDQILAFVGAPERVFVGRATLASGWHEWTDDEQARLAALGLVDPLFAAGVALNDVSVWDKPLPLFPTWEHTQAAKSNPKARWYGGIVSLTDADGRLIMEAVGEPPPVAPQDQVQPSESGPAAALFQAAEELRALPPGSKLTEYKTRSYLIDKYLYALGYTGVDDVDMGDAVASGSVPDYVLRANKKEVVALEAKALGVTLGPKEAAQVCQYCSGVGVRWGLLTDGRYLKLYDAPVLGKLPVDRLVFELDLSEYDGWADFETNVWPIAAMLSKEEMATGNALDRYAARELARSLLVDPSTKTVAALQQEMLEQKVPLSSEEVSQLISELL